MLNVIMLTVAMLTVVMLTVLMLTVVMLTVVAPSEPIIDSIKLFSVQLVTWPGKLVCLKLEKTIYI
jgi:hypothetical protein